MGADCSPKVFKIAARTTFIASRLDATTLFVRLAAWVSIINQNSKLFLWRFTATGEQALCEEKMFLKSLFGAKTMPVV
jgi:hypothetical protein